MRKQKNAKNLHGARSERRGVLSFNHGWTRSGSGREIHTGNVIEAQEETSMRFARASIWTFVVTMLLCSAPILAAESPINRRIENFSLRDYRGKLHTLDEFNDAKLVVVAFLGTECPLAKLYAPRWRNCRQFANQESPSSASTRIGRTRLPSWRPTPAFTASSFPLLKDPGNEVADDFGAQRTPEVFVLDADRKVRYRGRIDDQYGRGELRLRRAESRTSATWPRPSTSCWPAAR